MEVIWKKSHCRPKLESLQNCDFALAWSISQLRTSNLICSSWCFFVLILYSSNYMTQKQPLEVFYKEKVFLEILQHSQEKTCARVSFLIKFIKKETMAQMFSCEFCEFFTNTFFTEHFWTTAFNDKNVG